MLIGDSSHGVLGSGPVDGITDMSCSARVETTVGDGLADNPAEKPLRLSCFQNSSSEIPIFSIFCIILVSKFSLGSRSPMFVSLWIKDTFYLTFVFLIPLLEESLRLLK